MKKYFLVLVSLGSVLIGQAQSRSKITATDLTRIKQVGAISISPDQRAAVFTVHTTEPIPDAPLEYEYRTQIYKLDLLSKADPVALTRAQESSSQPAWAPDGSQIAFTRSVKGKSQVFILPLSGGEAWQLTHSPYGASGPRWSPDGKKILFSASLSFGEVFKDSVINPEKKTPIWPMEKPGFSGNDFLKGDAKIKPDPDGTLAEIRAYLEKDIEDKKAKVINRMNFQGEATTQPELSFSHLFVVDVVEKAVARAVTRGFYSYGQADWARDGKIYAVTQSDSLQHPDRSKTSRIVVVGAGGRLSTILKDPESAFSQPTISPDGKTMAFVVYRAALKPGSLDQGRIGLFTPGSNAQPFLSSFDRSAGGFTWAADGKSVYFTAPTNGGVPVYRLTVAGAKVEQLTTTETGISSFDVSANGVVFGKTEVQNPSELYTADLSFKAPVRRTSLNTEWLSGKKLSYPEKRTLKNSKGQTIEYWIMKPAEIAVGKKYPLLLQMHGGPTAMWGPGEGSMWHEFQFFCARGYGIVYANPRGSGGYGVDFMKANYQDWGAGPAEDVLAAATLAAKESWVDTSRQVITGGSYAGYLTAWIVAHDHRFKAAFAQRGVYELTTFMGEGNAWNLVPNYFGGYPWQEDIKKVMDANSPQTFVEAIRTPLLIKHGENDLRTGVIQSELLYKSLKILGRDAEYVRMPGGTHELSRAGNPRQRIDRILRIYEFFERYVGGK